MINLLPDRSRRKAIGEYRRRLMAGGAFFAALISAVGTLALAPSFLQSREEERSAAGAAAIASQNIGDPALLGAATDEERARQLLQAILKSAGPRPSAVLDLFVARHAGISVRSFTYASSGGRITVTLGGVAATRDALLGFREALQNIPGVSGADFPPADLAASSTIAFSIKMKYAPPN